MKETNLELKTSIYPYHHGKWIIHERYIRYYPYCYNIPKNTIKSQSSLLQWIKFIVDKSWSTKQDMIDLMFILSVEYPHYFK